MRQERYTPLGITIGKHDKPQPCVESWWQDAPREGFTAKGQQRAVAHAAKTRGASKESGLTAV